MRRLAELASSAITTTVATTTFITLSGFNFAKQHPWLTASAVVL